MVKGARVEVAAACRVQGSTGMVAPLQALPRWPISPPPFLSTSSRCASSWALRWLVNDSCSCAACSCSRRCCRRRRCSGVPPWLCASSSEPVQPLPLGAAPLLVAPRPPPTRAEMRSGLLLPPPVGGRSPCLSTSAGSLGMRGLVLAGDTELRLDCGRVGTDGKGMMEGELCHRRSPPRQGAAGQQQPARTCIDRQIALHDVVSSCQPTAPAARSSARSCSSEAAAAHGGWSGEAAGIAESLFIMRSIVYGCYFSAGTVTGALWRSRRLTQASSAGFFLGRACAASCSILRHHRALRIIYQYPPCSRRVCTSRTCSSAHCWSFCTVH